MRAKLTEGHVGAQLIKLTLPMIWGTFIFNSFNLVDTYFVAQLGTNELAAMSFTFPVVMIMTNVAMGLSTGTSSIIARVIGEGNRYRVQRLTTDSIVLSLLIAGIFAFLGEATINPLFTALGVSSDLLPLVREYMSIWYLGMICVVMPRVGNGVIRALGNTAVPSQIMTVAATFNMGLNPLLIFGWGSFPAMGLKGAALATVIARASTLVASLAFLHYRERLLLLVLPTVKEVWRSWRSLFQVGLPAAATNLIAPVSVALSTSLIAPYGSEAVAGFGIASRVGALALIALIALSISIGPFVGQNWGAKQYDRVTRAIRLSFLFCLGWGGLVTIILSTAALSIASRFDSHPAVVASAAAYLTIVPISYGALGVVLICGSTFNAVGKPLPSVVITLIRILLLYVPLAYLGSRFFGIHGVFGAACLSNIAVGLGVFIWSRRNCLSEKSLVRQCH